LYGGNKKGGHGPRVQEHLPVNGRSRKNFLDYRRENTRRGREQEGHIISAMGRKKSERSEGGENVLMTKGIHSKAQREELTPVISILVKKDTEGRKKKR